ncbi:MAG: adenylyl-sulfate kinase [Bacteroidota bacterium]
MKKIQKNIFPSFSEILQRSDKEAFLKQLSKVIWMTGLSGSGKTTLATGLEKELHKKGFLTQILDGDNIRAGINQNLDFSDEDRTENIRRVAEISKLFLNCGIITINCFVSPTKSMREQAKQIIGKDDFIEVFVNAPIKVCEQRDKKGLYEKARRGEIKDFTGVNAPFEPPENPDIEVNTGLLSVEECIKKIINHLLPQINFCSESDSIA